MPKAEQMWELGFLAELEWRAFERWLITASGQSALTKHAKLMWDEPDAERTDTN